MIYNVYMNVNKTQAARGRAKRKGKMECLFCGRLREKKEMIALLIRRLEMHSRSQERQVIPEVFDDQNAGFRQLVKIVFRHELANVRCRHNDLYCLLRRRLKWDSNYLNFVCCKLASELIRKNYELQVVAALIKTAEEAIEERQNYGISEVTEKMTTAQCMALSMAEQKKQISSGQPTNKVKKSDHFVIVNQHPKTINTNSLPKAQDLGSRRTPQWTNRSQTPLVPKQLSVSLRRANI